MPPASLDDCCLPTNANEEEWSHFLSSLGDDELIVGINRGFSAKFWSHYKTLKTKLDAETITPEEHAEIIACSDRMEARTVERLRFLLELSKRRGVAPRTLMQQFSIWSSSAKI